MKDYYYILGVPKDAPIASIQKAYQKLSLKFHPDNNGNDLFFRQYFDNISEAFHVLSDDHRRYRYDRAINREDIEADVSELSGPAPLISFFFASKSARKKGDLLTISWEVFNADEVFINLIGQVSTNGTQTIRILEEHEKEAHLNIVLNAKNKSQKTSQKSLKIVNLSFVAKEDKLSQRIERLSERISTANQTGDQKAEPDISLPKQSVMAYLIVVVICFIILVMLYKIHTLNPFF